MTGTRAASLLTDILRWRLQPWTPIEQVSAIRYDRDLVQGGDEGHLPFHMDQILSTPWSDGGSGVRNIEDVDKALRFWNPWMSYWTGEQSVFRQSPGAFFLQQLQENPVFSNVNGWDDDDQTAWDDFTEDLQAIHRTIARATGHAPRNRGLCPKCKTGNMLQQPGQHGFDEIAVCNNRECSATIDYSQEETSASIRAILRTATPDTWLTLDQVRKVWPRLDRRKLHVWIGRGKVAKHQGRYNLADINECMMPTRSEPASVVAEGV